MSRPELERFVADVKARKDLQDGVKSIHPSNEAVVEWANARGYDITVDELSEYIQDRKAELTEEELDRVVGGKGLSYDWTVTNQQGVSHTYDPRRLAMIGHDLFIAHPMAERIDAGWAGYKDTWASDKAKVQDSSPQDLIDAAQSYGATVGQSDGETDVTFADGARVTYDGQFDVHDGQPEGFTQVNLPGGGEVYHDFLVGSSGVHEGESTSVFLPNGSLYRNIQGQTSFESAPHDVNIAAEGQGEFTVSGPQGDSTFDVAKTQAAAEVTVTTDQGSAEYQVTPQSAAELWADHSEVPAAWNDPGTEITVQGNLGWSLDHTDASGPETTFTSASGTDLYLPPATDNVDWTVTNSQGDSRVFTPKQIYRGEVNWLSAHPKADHAIEPSSRETIGSIRERIGSIEEDVAAEENGTVSYGQDQAVQDWEQSFDSLKASGGGTLPHGVSLNVESPIDGWVITTPQDNKIFWGDGEQIVRGPVRTVEGPQGTVSVQRGIKHIDADSSLNPDEGQPYWEIVTASSADEAIQHITWGAGDVSDQGANANFSVHVQDGRVVGVKTEHADIDPGSGDSYIIGPEGDSAVETIPDGEATAWRITAPYGEQWTIEEGATRASSASSDQQQAAHDVGITIASQWEVTNESGQGTVYYPEQLQNAREDWVGAHPEGAQGIDTWGADKELYQSDKEAWAQDPAEWRIPRKGEFDGAKGEVRYAITPASGGESGYDVVIDGPDALLTVQPDGSKRSVEYESDQSGTEVSVHAYFSDGQLEGLDTTHFYYSSGGGAGPSQLITPTGQVWFSTTDGRDQRPATIEVTLPDGNDVSASRGTWVDGPHGRDLITYYTPGADPKMQLSLADGTTIEWQRSDETRSEDGVSLSQDNLNYFYVMGEDQSFEWNPEDGLAYWSEATGTVALTPPHVGQSYSSNMNIIDGTNYTPVSPAPEYDSYTFSTPHGTVQIEAEEGFGPRGSDTWFDNEVIVSFNDGLTLVHEPHFTELSKGTFSPAQMVASDSQPVELLWEYGRLDQVGQKEIRPRGEIEFQTPSGGVMAVVPGSSSSSGSEQLSYEGPKGNVFSFDAGGSPTFSLDGAQVERGQDVTMMGPDGRISVEWGVPYRDLPDGSSKSGTDSGLVVFGVHGDVQVAQIEQDGHRAWVIDNTRVVSPYNYVSEVESGEAPPPAASNLLVVTQVEILADEFAATDTTAALQVELALEVVAVAAAVLT